MGPHHHGYGLSTFFVNSSFVRSAMRWTDYKKKAEEAA